MSSESPTMIGCPIDECEVEAAVFDYDRMFGHLQRVHEWSFNDSQEWVNEQMADREEAEREEEIFMGGPVSSGSMDDDS